MFWSLLLSEQWDTHPLPVQQQVESEVHAVLQGHLLIPVQDLKDPTEHAAIVNPCAAETALAYQDRQTDREEEKVDYFSAVHITASPERDSPLREYQSTFSDASLQKERCRCFIHIQSVVFRQYFLTAFGRIVI